jgi:hypothetical protein
VREGYRDVQSFYGYVALRYHPVFVDSIIFRLR